MNKNILVVDDDQEILDMTKSLLGKRDFNVATAHNGKDALKILETERPDLILLDVLMPEMDGYTFYKELKKSELTNEIPVLVITGRGKMEDSFKVLGVDGFITKPFLPEQLLNTIKHTFEITAAKNILDPNNFHGNKKRILVIGPHKIILNSMGIQAEKIGCEITKVDSGAEAIATAVKFLPDIIFLDVQLNDISAAEVVNVLRRIPYLESKPIIGYSYYETADLAQLEIRRKMLNIEEASQRIMETGATVYMGRYNPHLFITHITKYLKSQKK